MIFSFSSLITGFFKKCILNLPQHSHYMSVWPSERFRKMLQSRRSMEDLSAPTESPSVPWTQNKLYEPHLGREKPVTELIEPLLGITKPTEGLNMPYFNRKFGRRYFTAKVKRPISLPRHLLNLWRYYTDKANLKLVLFVITII